MNGIPLESGVNDCYWNWDFSKIQSLGGVDYLKAAPMDPVHFQPWLENLQAGPWKHREIFSGICRACHQDDDESPCPVPPPLRSLAEVWEEMRNKFGSNKEYWLDKLYIAWTIFCPELYEQSYPSITWFAWNATLPQRILCGLIAMYTEWEKGQKK